MPLKLSLKTHHGIPIDVRGLSVGISQSLNASQIGNLMIRIGNRAVRVSECFEISGDPGDGREFVLNGDLSKVHSIGRGISGGRIIAESAKVGRHVGTAMSGGNVTVLGDAGNFVGAAMTGGTIHVTGNAGDFVGSALEGAKYGMNRGEIFIERNAGVGLGKRMRRGTIVVGGDVGELAAWNMLAGTIVVLGSHSNAGSTSRAAKTASGIVRGTVVLAGDELNPRDFAGAMLSSGGNIESQIVEFLAAWLTKRCPESLAKSVERKLHRRPFVKYNGTELNQNRAEIFVRLQDALNA